MSFAISPLGSGEIDFSRLFKESYIYSKKRLDKFLRDVILYIIGYYYINIAHT